ncbi:MAG: autotransporter-associated beta strand repeat-containing protein [Kiritimatiellae bacterium]|nr:autotransporter-associated beta strand repeat-containing protein [Kiritimatiellia bacterium]
MKKYVFAWLVACLFSVCGTRAETSIDFSQNNTARITTGQKITTASFTVEGWVYPTRYATEQLFFSQYASGVNGRFTVGLWQDKFQVFFGGGGGNIGSGASIPLNKWSHLAVSRDANGKWTFYVNGRSVKTVTNGTIIPVDTTIQLGNAASLSNSFKGMVSDIRVWSDVRTDAEIRRYFMQRLPNAIVNDAGNNNLLAYWPLDEGSGATTVERVSSSNSSLQNSIWMESGELALGNPAKDPPALYLNKDTQNSIRTDIAITTVDFTLECWCWYAGPYTNAEYDILGQYLGGNPGRMLFGVKNDNLALFLGNDSWRESGTKIPRNRWTHIAVTHGSDGIWQFYTNGVPAGRITGRNAIAPANTPLTIGSFQNGSSMFYGAVSDVRAWSCVRTDSEISENYAKRLNGNETGLLGYWKLDEGTTPVVNAVTQTSSSVNKGEWSAIPLYLITTIQSAYWIGPAQGNWNAAPNWDSAIPNGSSSAVFVTNETSVSIANDLSPLTFESLSFTGSGPYAITGNAITLGTATGQDSTIRLCGDSSALSLSSPLELLGGGMLLAPTSGTITVSGAISGNGKLVLNSGEEGGIISLQGVRGANAGETILNRGMLSFDSAAELGTGAYTLGPGTLRYTGTAPVTLSNPITIAAGGVGKDDANTKATIFDTDEDITITGIVDCMSGTILKRGHGTLTLAGIGTQILDKSYHPPWHRLDFPENGDSPVIYGFCVADGAIALGTAGQTNLMPNGRIVIGAYTSDDHETEGELIVNGGYLSVDGSIIIGYNNGTETSAPTPLHSRMTVNDGEVQCGLQLILGDNEVGLAGFNAQPFFTMNGGTVTIATQTMLGKASGGVATLELNGGLFRTPKLFCSGNNSTLTGQGIVRCNGGELELTGNNTVSSLTRIDVLGDGAVFRADVSSWTLAKALTSAASPDGGFRKTGTNTLTLASTGNDWNGPAVAAAGLLRITAETSLPGTGLEILADSEVSLQAASSTASQRSLSVQSLTLRANGILSLCVSGGGNDTVAVTGTPVFENGAKIRLRRDDSEDTVSVNGTYRLINYTGTAPDVSGLSVIAPVAGKSYVFAAADGWVTLTIANGGAGVSVWNVDADGNWATAANWTIAPNAGDAVRFDDAITAARTVHTAGESSSGLYFNNASSYTLDGSGLTLTGTDPAVISTETGSHAITAPLTLNTPAELYLGGGTSLDLGTVQANGFALRLMGRNGTLRFTADTAAPIELTGNNALTAPQGTRKTLSGTISGTGDLQKVGAGTISLTGNNTYTGTTTIRGGGTLEIASADAFNSSTSLKMELGTFHITGEDVSLLPPFQFYTPNAKGQSVVIQTDGNATINLATVENRGALIKTGPGKLTLTQTGSKTNILASHSADLSTVKRVVFSPDATPTNGFDAVNVADGILELNLANDNTTLRVKSGRLLIGLNTTESGTETEGTLVLKRGRLISLNTCGIGWNNGTTTTAPQGARSGLIIDGGHAELGTVSLGLNTSYWLSGYNAHPYVTVNSGTLTCPLVIGEYAGSVGTVTINGGTCDFDTVEIGRNGSGTLILNGGTVSATRIFGGNSGPVRELHFNGSTLIPKNNNQLNNLTAAKVMAGGACIDTRNFDYTISQALLAGEENDGGLTKLGTNTLNITAMNSTYRGPVRVEGGTLKGFLGVTNALFLAQGATYDLNGGTTVVGDFTGPGLASNGTLRVTGRLDASTNTAPAQLAVQADLELPSGMTFVIKSTANGNNRLAVTGNLALDNNLIVDLGRDANNPVSVPYSTTLAQYTGSASRTNVKCSVVNTGLPANTPIDAVLIAQDGTLTFRLTYGGTIILIR